MENGAHVESFCFYLRRASYKTFDEASKEETLGFRAGAWLSRYWGGSFGLLLVVALCVPFVPSALAKVHTFFFVPTCSEVTQGK
ncbi:MAG: hypothetical protein U0Y68_09985 [Blastocatellia bacterium]